MIYQTMIYQAMIYMVVEERRLARPVGEDARPPQLLSSG
jgi:hypothetical protein